MAAKLEMALEGQQTGPKPDLTAYVGAQTFGHHHTKHLKLLGIALERCGQIDALAKHLGCAAPAAGPWMQMLTDVLETAPYGILVVDMKVPGLPMSYVNPAMVALTGYAKEQLEGHNCRMLQGPNSEAAAIAKMVDAIRLGEQATSILVTNYTAQGTEFVNALTIKPVRDWYGTYRYSVGILCHMEEEKRERSLIRSLCECIPDRFNPSLQAQKIRAQLTPDDEQKRAAVGEKQWVASLTQFTRLLWSLDWEAALRRIVSRPDCFPVLGAWLAEQDRLEGRKDAPIFELILVVTELEREVDREVQRGALRDEISQREISQREISQREISQREISQHEISQREISQREDEPAGEKAHQLEGQGCAGKAISLASLYLSEQYDDDGAAMDALLDKVSFATSTLCADAFPRFVASPMGVRVIKKLLGHQRLADGQPLNLVSTDGAGNAAADEITELIWAGYAVPPDVAGWVHSLVTVAETFTACIAVSDMSMSGNPMFFVNREFCRTTGYSKEEVHGRNCRFLQGPRTEPESVAVIQDALRRGVDCFVKITNYRKSGEMFTNLLTMRPVHDTNGVYRFCIGVQSEATEEIPSSERLGHLEKLLQLLPATIDVVSRTPVGQVHAKFESSKEVSTTEACALKCRPPRAPPTYRL